ncbi:hypothetical protein PM082_010724 [Marasmius tenuissimus]|nr:hypothetical protein PM082_010724 [Marasmius tenuissimus]
MKNDSFIKNLVYFYCEEVHLIQDWGATFQPSFKFIGLTACGKLPDHVPIIALSATCPPGPITDSICRSLRLMGNNFHTIQQSNKRLNMQLIVKPFKHVHGLSKYHQIYPYVCSVHKLIIHINTIPEAYDIYLFLFNLLLESCNCLCCIWMYHSLCTDDYNTETLEFIDNDPYLQVVIATIGFTNGINCSAICDCISWKLPMTLDQLLQQLGRGGHSSDVLCRGIAIASPDDIKKAKVLMTGTASSVDAQGADGQMKKAKLKKCDVQSLDNGKA